MYDLREPGISHSCFNECAADADKYDTSIIVLMKSIFCSLQPFYSLAHNT